MGATGWLGREISRPKDEGALPAILCDPRALDNQQDRWDKLSDPIPLLASRRPMKS